MKKRFSVVLFILIICLVFSSCITSVTSTTGTSDPKNSTSVEMSSTPIPSPTQTYYAEDLSGKTPAQLLKIDVPESENQILYNALLNFSVPDMFDVYAGETDPGIKKTILKNIVFVCENTDRFYEFIDTTNTRLTPADFENMDDAGFKIIISHCFDLVTEKAIRTMDKDRLWDKIYPFLIKGDKDTAMLIGLLSYPEYSDRIQSFLKSGNPYASDLEYYMITDGVVTQPSTSPTTELSPPPSTSSSSTVILTDPLDALKIKKTGKSGGPINSIIIVKFYKDDDGKYNYDILDYTYSLVSSDKQGYSYSTDINAVIYIKTTYSYGGKYYFKGLHKYVKGYRVGYKIVMVDLRTKHILSTKTLKALKLPKYIYDNELENGKYYTNPPSDAKVESALKSLLKKYGLLSAI